MQYAAKSINGQRVEIEDILTYEISYTNESGVTIDELVIEDSSPYGTSYKEDTAKLTILDGNGNKIDLESSEETFLGVDNNGNSIYITGNVNVSTKTHDPKTEENSKYSVVTNVADITWTVNNLPDGYTVKVSFDVDVTEDALEIETKTVENDADVIVKIGDNIYNLKTNLVENPVDDPDDPVKDVLNQAGASIDGEKVQVGNTLTYKITYTNNSEEALDSVVITDAPPTGTVYVADSARGCRTNGDKIEKDENGKYVSDGVAIVVSADGTITWTYKNVAISETVTVYFDVEVTEAAQSIADKIIVNDAGVKINNDPEIRTNVVTNPVEPEEPDKPDDPNPGKVIINSDGSESTVSTGAFGERVTFDISINAVNKVKNDANEIVQVEKYYIYDKLDPGFTLDADSMVVTINGNQYKVGSGKSNDNNVTTYAIEKMWVSFMFASHIL